MNRRLTIVALIAGAFASGPELAFGAAIETPAEAPAPAERPMVRLVIDTSGMFEDQREDTARWIREDGTPVLEDAGVTVVDDASAELEIRVAVKVEGVGYAVETTVWKPGASKPEVDRGHRVCEACVRSEVVRLVARELAWVGGWLAVRPASAEPDAPPVQPVEPDDDPVTQESSTANEPRDPPARKPGYVLRNAGLALVVPGGIALGVGIGLVAAGKRNVENPNGDDAVIAERNYRPPGIALAVTGGVAAAAGVALLVVHARRARSGNRSQMAWSPVLSGTHVGVALAGRF